MIDINTLGQSRIQANPGDLKLRQTIERIRTNLNSVEDGRGRIQRMWEGK
jgi:hypothetical protein